MAFFYIDRFLGGVTTGGWSPPCSSFGTGLFTISIPAGCTIRQAYLMAGQCGNTNNNLTVTLNGLPYSFSNTTRIGTAFDSVYGTSSSVHAIDITADISPLINNYSLTVPVQSNVVQRYSDFMLVVMFENGTMDVVDVCIFLNDQSMVTNYLHTYNLSFPIPISTAGDVAIGIFGGYICNDNTTGGGNHDAENIEVNNTLLGHIGGVGGDGLCGGSGFVPPRGNFTYSNSTLTALANCNANLSVSALDALTQINSLLTNGATFFSFEFNAEEISNYTNNLWALVIAYTDIQPMPFECQKPNSIVTSLITQTSARATWTYPVLCSGVLGDVNFQYRVVGSPTWTVVPLSGVGLYNMAGLTTATNYEYQIVSTNCAGAICAPSDITPFTTL